uniref:FCP1 homology domain-containing protein n=1 Tax=Lotharella oceanica TaxID=641309 RepID=A0A7S2TNY8_9EUKA|mmetsp:Transcript_23026/g.43241  ORF Transcript_23026/g.43241 Transcript_23026/m.43241 type:complete len:325 (+) Transcript_23026:38-1012(+)
MGNASGKTRQGWRKKKVSTATGSEKIRKSSAQDSIKTQSTATTATMDVENPNETPKGEKKGRPSAPPNKTVVPINEEETEGRQGGNFRPSNKRISVKPTAYSGLLPPPKKEHENKLCVVLDMDETLIHSKFESQRNCYRQEEKRQAEKMRGADVQFELTLNGGATKEKVSVFKRPGLDKFLEEASKKFEVVVFTAAIPIYAKPVLDLIDPNNYITSRLYRSSTVTFEGQPYVKDISLLDRDMARIVLVDNNPAAMLACPDNAIPILSFYDSELDHELESLLPLLEQIEKTPDVRPQLVQRFRFRAMIEEAKAMAGRGEDSVSMQ